MKNEITAPMIMIETDRLLLRPMVEDDAELIVHWRNSQHIAAMSIESSKGSITVGDHLSWFARSRPNRVDYVIELKERHCPIGSVSFIWQNLRNSMLCGELGKYIGDKPSLGKGYASEATSRWIRYAFEDVGLDCVMSRTRGDNLANIKVNQKLGFTIQSWPEQFELISDDWIFMSLTKTEWLQSQRVLDRRPS